MTHWMHVLGWYTCSVLAFLLILAIIVLVSHCVRWFTSQERRERRCSHLFIPEYDPPINPTGNLIGKRCKFCTKFIPVKDMLSHEIDHD